VSAANGAWFDQTVELLVERHAALASAR
jgi:hypothetical protein